VKKLLSLIKISLVLTLVVVMAAGCSTKDKPYADTLVLKVDDSKVYLDEMMYHVMLAEMQGQLYASFTGDGKDYWNIKTEDGTTMAEAMKDMAMQNAIRYELFYNMAIDNGYALTDEEKEISKDKVENIKNNIQPEQLQLTELSDEQFVKIQDKIALATKYYDEYVKTLNVDEEAIKATFNPNDYKQYDIQYIFAKKDEYEALTSLLDTAKVTEDLTTLTDDSKVSSGKLSFIEGSNTFGEEKLLEETIKTMSNGEVSNIIETNKGYYIIKLIDNTSTEKYDSAVKEAVDSAITDAFDKEFTELKKKHNIEIKEKVWKKIKMGSTIITTENISLN
jgi:foldase protein PrsA